MRLTELKTNQQARISRIHHLNESGAIAQKDMIAARLANLGFVPGESVEIITKGLFGGEPLLIKVGYTRFALRLNEAQRIEVEIGTTS